MATPAAAVTLEIDVTGEAEGTIVIDLFEEVAPLHVERIVTLALEGAYDDVVFHRVIDGFMAQTGDVEFGQMGMDMRYAGRGGSEYDDLPAEFSDLSFEVGMVGMARSGDPRCGGNPNCEEAEEFLNSANSQFFIMFDDVPQLDGQYTVVGQVIEGMDVVEAIKRGAGRNGAVIGQPDRIVAMRVIED
jgi:peptidylprolyl isomerase